MAELSSLTLESQNVKQKCQHGWFMVRTLYALQKGTLLCSQVALSIATHISVLLLSLCFLKKGGGVIFVYVCGHRLARANCTTCVQEPAAASRGHWILWN